MYSSRSMAVSRLQASRCGDSPIQTDGRPQVSEAPQHRLTIAATTIRTVERVLVTVTEVSHDIVTGVTAAASHHDTELWEMFLFSLFV